MATINVTGKDAQVSSRNKEHAREKLSKLTRYFNGVGTIDAVLGHSGEGADVEVVISIPRGNPIVCRSRAHDLYSAIDLVVDKAGTQLTRYKERLKDRKAPSKEDAEVPAEEASAGENAEEDTLESYDQVIEKRDFN